MKLPYQRWDSDRYLGSTACRTLSLEQKGLYRDLLDIAWSHGPAKDAEIEPHLPADTEEIRFLSGCSREEWERCWPRVERFWQTRKQGTKTVLISGPQVTYWRNALESVSIRSEAARTAANARWHPRRMRNESQSDAARMRTHSDRMRRDAIESKKEKESKTEKVSSTSESSSSRSSTNRLDRRRTRTREPEDPLTIPPLPPSGRYADDDYQSLIKTLSGKTLTPKQLDSLRAFLENRYNGDQLEALGRILAVMRAEKFGLGFLVSQLQKPEELYLFERKRWTAKLTEAFDALGSGSRAVDCLAAVACRLDLPESFIRQLQPLPEEES